MASPMNERSCRSAKTSKEPRGPLRSGNGALAFALRHPRPFRGCRPRSILRPNPNFRNRRLELRWWCGRRDLNPQGFLHGLLRPARLPFRHARAWKWSLSRASDRAELRFSLRWSVAGHCGGSLATGALGASRRSPSATFATNEPSKEAHDSEVLVTQCRRARRPRRREPTAVSGHAAPHHQASEIASWPKARRRPALRAALALAPVR